jgi:5S rRNA maturation endonuclease (ribonuclease M5)
MYESNFDPRGKYNNFISKESILQQISENDIFIKYLGIPITNQQHKSPFREDKNPSCKFYYNGSKWKWRDIGRNINEDCFGIVMMRYGLSLDQALQKIVSEFNLKIEDSSLKTKDVGLINTYRSVIEIKIRDWDLKDKNYWTQFGITCKTLNLFKTFPIKISWIDNKINFIDTENSLGYAYCFPDYSIKLYYPIVKDKTKKFRGNSSYIQGYNVLPETGDILFITKSQKDNMCLYELGYNAISPQSESNKISSELIIELKQRFKKVILFFDNDETGKLQSELKSEFLDIEYILIPDGYPKDISDFIKKYDKDNAIELIESLLCI